MMIHSSSNNIDNNNNNNNHHNSIINDEHHKDTNWNKITSDDSFFTRYNNRRKIEFVPERSLEAKHDSIHATSSSNISNSCSNIKNDVESRDRKNLKDNIVVVFKGKDNTNSSSSSSSSGVSGSGTGGGNSHGSSDQSSKVIGLFDEKLVMKYIKWNKIMRIGPGFYNDGNSCYLNSTLQCLIHTPPLAQILKHETGVIMHNIGLKNQHVYTSNQQVKPILQHFQSLVNEVWNANSSGKAISPRGEL